LSSSVHSKLAFFRIGNAFACRPGVGLYDITREQFIDCCCEEGLIVSGISFETIGEPDCFLVQRGQAQSVCVRGSTSPEAGLEIATDYIDALEYITKCRPTAGSPNPDDNFCQDATPVFSYVDARETDDGYEFDFEVEDCGIEPVDYIATVAVRRC